MRRTWISILTLLALLSILWVCTADVIFFKDGRKIEGTIVSKDSKSVTIKTKYGTRTFSLDEISSIEKKKTLEEEYRERAEQVDNRDIEAVFKLVDWCLQNKLDSKARIHLKEIIKLDPNNERARKLLGYEYYKGKWFTPRELKAFKEKEERDEKLAQGLVEYKGQWLPKEDVEKIKAGMVMYKGKWVTPEEKERLEKNLVKYEGQWLPKEDVEKMKQGLFKVGDRWLDKKEANRIHSDWENPWVVKSDHICVRTDKDYDLAQKVLAEAERTYRTMKNLVGIEPNLKDTFLTIYMVGSMEEYNTIGNAIGDEKSSYYPVFYVEETEDGPVCVTYCLGDTDNDIRFTMGLIRHATSELYLRRIDVKGEFPLWFIKGEAAKSERFFHPKYIRWSLKALRKGGGFIKLDQFFDNFGFTEHEILMSGLLCAYLDDKQKDQKISHAFQVVLDSIKMKKKKISSEFVKLEKAMVRQEKAIRAWVSKY